MEFSLKTLEFPLIKKAVNKYLYSNQATTLLENLVPSSIFTIVSNSLNETNELLNIIVKYSKIPFLENFDNNIITNKVIENKIYSIEELLYLKLYLNMEVAILNYFNAATKETKVHYLNQYINLFNNQKLLKELNKVISSLGEIYDDATLELKRIRLKTKRLNEELNEKLHNVAKKYQSYLTDILIVKRNDRFCLQVKETYKNKIKGVVHDISQSGQTIFIEPEISLILSSEIELNNLLEAKEISKILTNLTNLVNDNILNLKTNLDNLIHLDLINAKALYALEIDGVKPNINSDGIVDLIDAKHPLIKKEDVVPISLSLSENDHTLLITGPNTGGKTVSLKTVGLLTMMVQSGMLVPVNYDSNFNIFENIFADIGDDQSILNSLSTFSSHLTKIIKFLSNLTDNSLVLLDEIGSGTDPNEGISLAIAIIEEFLKKDIRLIVTSHFSELKTYAYEQVGFKTASVAFSTKTLKPLYYLEHGITGESHARLIAKRLGMNEAVIIRANELFASRESDIHKIIAKLNEERNYYQEELKKALSMKAEFEKQIKELELLKEKLISEQNLEIERVTQEELLKWQKRQKEIDELIAKIENEYESHHLATLKNLRSKSITKTEAYDDTVVLNVGDYVYIKPYQQYGTIKSIKNDRYQVVFGIFDLTFELKDLKLEKPKEKVSKPVRKSKVVKADVDRTNVLTIDLRGYRFEEVALKLDKAFDQAILSNIHSLTIIHGFGTGAIKKATTEYLKKSPLVKSYRFGGEGEGMQGVTIVTLK